MEQPFLIIIYIQACWVLAEATFQTITGCKEWSTFYRHRLNLASEWEKGDSTPEKSG